MRAPALRFAAVGALLFVAVAHRGGAPPPDASASASTATANAATDDALLFDVALNAGLDRTDPFVRARLVNLGRYLSLAPEGADDATVEQAARAMHLVRSDPIIRRHLIDLMLLAAKTLPPTALPTEAELRAYYAAHAAQYALAPRVRLSHVYLSRDRRGAHLASDAAAVAVRLRVGDATGGLALGDSFARGAQIGFVTEAELARIFGSGFAAEVMALPPGQWSPPIVSAYGLHLVWIEERVASSAPRFEEVRGQLLHAWLREHRAARLAASLSALRG